MQTGSAATLSTEYAQAAWLNEVSLTQTGDTKVASKPKMMQISVRDGSIPKG